MIPPRNGTPGTIGAQHGLTKLTTTLESLERGQRAAEQRDSQLQAQLTSQASALTQLAQRVHLLRSLLLGVAAMVALLAGLVGWQMTHQPDMAYARALGTLDGALVQQWEKLPKPIQEQLSATYGRIGLASPGQRK
jgi:hypothetical protein